MKYVVTEKTYRRLADEMVRFNRTAGLTDKTRDESAILRILGLYETWCIRYPDGERLLITAYGR